MVVSSSALRTGRLYSRKCSWYPFLLEAESTPGPSPMTPAGTEPATFWFVAQHLNHRATAVPIQQMYLHKFSTQLSPRKLHIHKQIAHETETCNPHNSSNWDSHTTRQLGYKDTFCQSVVYTKNYFSLYFRKNITRLKDCLFKIGKVLFHAKLSIGGLRPIFVSRGKYRYNITQLSIPTHALQRHRLKFIKNHLKNSYIFRSSTIFGELQRPR